MGCGAILKCKACKDDPTQIPIGTPIALIFIADALIYIPTIFSVSGETLSGSIFPWSPYSRLWRVKRECGFDTGFGDAAARRCRCSRPWSAALPA
jgi:hypothetical protein